MGSLVILCMVGLHLLLSSSGHVSQIDPRYASLNSKHIFLPLPALVRGTAKAERLKTKGLHQMQAPVSYRVMIQQA